MLVAMKGKSTAIAMDSEKDGGPYSCPECGDVLQLKKGFLKVHHFSHIPGSSCHYGIESVAHREAKVSLFTQLKNSTQCSGVALEHLIRKGSIVRRPDVLARIRWHLVAFELQKSTIDTKELFNRTRDLNRLGCAVSWIGVKPWILNSTAFETRVKHLDKVMQTLHGAFFVWSGPSKKFFKIELSETYSERGHRLRATRSVQDISPLYMGDGSIGDFKGFKLWTPRFGN